MEATVIEAADHLSPEHWEMALTCGDMIDRLPCQRCGAARLSACAKPLTPEQIDAARDFINGYGWEAARERMILPPAPARRSMWQRLTATLQPKDPK